jgi:hypothetical protein
MLRIAALALGAALVLGTGACTVDRDVSQSTLQRGIDNDIEESRRPATTDARPVMPSVPPPITVPGPVPASPITVPDRGASSRL